MIQKLGAAFKKMAQRSMLRGNRGDAQAVSEFGIEGMRSNLSNQVQNKITPHPNLSANKVSDVAVQANVSNVKNDFHNANTPKQNLGGSVLGAIDPES
jgi:hypothetical protein